MENCSSQYAQWKKMGMLEEEGGSRGGVVIQTVKTPASPHMSPLPGVTLLRLSVTGSYLQSSSDTQIPASFHREGSNLGVSMVLDPIPPSR